MFVSEDLAVNEKGHLTIGGVDTISLAKEYGTPLYVMDEDLIRKHCRSFRSRPGIADNNAVNGSEPAVGAVPRRARKK